MSCNILREQDEFHCTKCNRRWPVGETIDCVNPVGRDVPFSDLEASLFNKLMVNTDTSIATLFRQIADPMRKPDPRDQQQHVGSFISRMNRKLTDHGYEIVPGIARATYRLQRVAP